MSNLSKALIALFIGFLVAAVCIFPKGAVDKTSITPYVGSLYSAKIIGVEDTGKGLFSAHLVTENTDITIFVDPKYVSLIHEGDKVQIYKVDNFEPTGADTANGQTTPFFFYGFERTFPLGVFLFLYIIVVVVVARFKGVRAILGLSAALAIILLFTVPTIFAGANTLLAGFISSVLIMFVVLYLAHGFNKKTSTALLGTLLGLGTTTILSLIATSVFHLSGLETEEAIMLGSTFPLIKLQAVVQCGIIIGALGVLNDVTITQSSLVDELHDLDPTLKTMGLFKRAMKVGQDHIASTVYTITFAYIGASLPVVLWVYSIDIPLIQKLTSEVMITEIVSTLVGGIGLVLAIPFTTIVAAKSAQMTAAKLVKQRELSRELSVRNDTL